MDGEAQECLIVNIQSIEVVQRVNVKGLLMKDANNVCNIEINGVSKGVLDTCTITDNNRLCQGRLRPSV